MKSGDLVRVRKIHPNYFIGDLFESWEYHESKLPTLLGKFPNNTVGIVLEIVKGSSASRRRVDTTATCGAEGCVVTEGIAFYPGTGVKVIVGDIVGWTNGDDLEIV